MVKGDASDGTTVAPATQAMVEELPRTIVRRVVKEKLSHLSSSSRKKSKSDDGGNEEMILHRDALLAFSESTRIFIHYLSATANDICKESKRQTINAEDVFKALDEMEFPEFIQPLRASLQEFRRKNTMKKSGAKAKETKKRKSQDHLPAQDEKDQESYHGENS
ncbi:Nuclear transcription factor Y subunit B-3 [Apostasia shenzhenica]|uniref:Nuclear transcription factor Y subunit B-3 n=1 Tax=Apostasia shenzhenica TaxID=1088818 RepID=A0A2I0BHC2_9ASPA|nr:Nuclear transcription factor Y subunit B-3 [Apostasia shenzhenica]